MMNKLHKRSSAAVRMIGCIAGGIFLSIIISAQAALAEGYTGKGAGIGAFMGLVFGDHPWDVAEGAITGAVVGGVADSAVSAERERAYALAGAGGTSSNKNHQIASIWLEASTAVDRKETKRAQAAFKRIVQQDPDIDSIQQAGIECDKIVLGMRQERRELGMGPCR